MIKLETLKLDITTWLEGLPRHRVVGIRNDPNRCVLSNFLTAAGCKAVTVRKGRAKFSGFLGFELPPWACTYYSWMDNSCGRKTGGYTAATALRVLEEA